MALSDPLTAVAHRTQTLRILVIDDSDADRMAYRRMLGKVSDLEVQLTETGLGLDGVELALEGEFDCILLDYFLPDAEALECLERLTVASGRSGPLDPPVIVLTGEGNEQVAAEVMRSGASDYIPKAAISPASLGRSITNAVAKAGMRRDIARSQEELRVANADLRRRNREIETFYHSLSHELKTPLTGAREFASILLDGLGGSLSEVQAEYLGYVLSSCDRMQVYINDILDVARIDSGRPKLRPRWCEVDELMRSIIALVRPPAERAGVTITLETEAGLPQVYVDPDRISQVLSNLVNNAVKFSPEGERVRVKAIRSKDRSHVLVQVMDRGPGIPLDKQAMIFERLYQIEDSTSAAPRAGMHPGLGLGLYISRALVRGHGQDIALRSIPGIGSTFEFGLPLEPFRAEG